MDTKQAKFIERNAWVFRHPDASALRQLILASPLAIAFEIWVKLPQDGATLQEMAEKLDANPNTIAIATRAMAKAGVIKRVRCEEDRRQVIVERI